MKYIADMESWILRATELFGDPANTVGQIFAKYVPADPREFSDIVAKWEPKESTLHVTIPQGWLPLKISTTGPKGDETGLSAFGIEQVCPGFWTLTPSLNISGLIHAFVHIYDVPTIAPWESRIILAGGPFS